MEFQMNLCLTMDLLLHHMNLNNLQKDMEYFIKHQALTTHNQMEKLKTL